MAAVQDDTIMDEGIPYAITSPLQHCQPESPHITKSFKDKHLFRGMMRAEVLFGAGAEVTGMTLPTDFTAVRVWDPVGEVTFRYVLKRVMAFSDIKPGHLTAVALLNTREGVRYLEIAVDDRHFARNFCSGFGALDEVDGSSYAASIERIAVPSYVPRGPVPSRYTSATDSATVRLTWRKPTKQAMLVYRDKAKAQELHRQIFMGRRKTFGPHVRALVFDTTDGEFAVNLWVLPLHFTREDIISRLPKELIPDNVICTGPRGYGLEEEAGEMEALVRKLESIGPLASEPCREGVHDYRTAGYQARFVDEADARRAVKQFNNTMTPFDRKAVVNVKLLFTTTFVFPAAWAGLYSLLAEKCRLVYPTVGLELKEDAASRTLVLKAVGEDSKSMTGMRTAFEETMGLMSESLDAEARTVEARFQEAYPTFRLREGENLSELECPICMDEPAIPIRSSCGHVYCKGCYVSLAQSAAGTRTDGAIKCFGDEGACKKPIPIVELRAILPGKSFETLLASSMRSYVCSHPLELRFCPTPDCQQLYRPTPAGANVNAVARCPDCLVVMCTACHAPHDESVLCSEAREKDDNAEIRKALGVKPCPQCRTPIERSGGCNHLECGVCYAHICWACMKHYRTSAECYAHMEEAHEGAFAGIPGMDVYGGLIEEDDLVAAGVQAVLAVLNGAMDE
ncbi:ATP-dependent RNA helicase DEAH11 [Colletotrichum shisoi]|uniref:RBR-type E3 ubiquitin transferase n=1 Tax=Colletotrichum shisoi TaxID=2078593 RepID=A0A5Q4BWA9_9PEZI|nr:ATP-dependent RNA helicase DEAH11 [Colletotrichum shisoi]